MTRGSSLFHRPSYQDDAYSTDPSLPAPPQVPADLTLVAPFLRYELVKDNFEKVKNRNLIERVEYFALGLHLRLPNGARHDRPGFHARQWLYNATVSDGLRVITGCNRWLPRTLNGRYGKRGVVSPFLRPSGNTTESGAGADCSLPSLSADTIVNGEPADQFELEAKTACALPARYQTARTGSAVSGTTRFTDWYPFGFRVGGAVSYDYGRAWGGGETRTSSIPDGLSEVGIGLRILNPHLTRRRAAHRSRIPTSSPTPISSRTSFSVNWKTTF